MAHQPKVLTYRFHDFKPSDRQYLRQVVSDEKGVDAFIAALDIYLNRWAIGDWLSDYDLERIVIWAEVHKLYTLIDKIEHLAKFELSKAQSENARVTYTTIIEAVAVEKSNRKNLVGSQVVAST